MSFYLLGHIIMVLGYSTVIIYHHPGSPQSSIHPTFIRHLPALDTVSHSLVFGSQARWGPHWPLLATASSNNHHRPAPALATFLSMIRLQHPAMSRLIFMMALFSR